MVNSDGLVFANIVIEHHYDKMGLQAYAPSDLWSTYDSALSQQAYRSLPFD